jgi:hypothetical protein
MTWKKGESGNLAGRPRGKRSIFSSAFVADMTENWRKNGATAIQRVYEERPEIYLKVALALIPKEFLLEVSRPLERMSDADLQLAAEQEREQQTKLIEHLRGKVGGHIIETAAREVLGEDADADGNGDE